MAALAQPAAAEKIAELLLEMASNER
jgi:hypothetical protein